MLERIKNFAFYGDTDRETYYLIKKRIEDYNRISMMVFSSLASVFTFVMFLLSYQLESFDSSRFVFLLGVIGSLILFGVSLASHKYPLLTYISVYMAVSVFQLYGIAIATLTRPDEQTVTFMVMLIFVPLIFIDRPIRMAAVLISYVVAFVLLAAKFKQPALLSADITDAVVYGALSVASQAVVNRAKIKGYVLENKLHIMGETDQLTGLNNRNCYEQRLSTYPSVSRRSLCCIYIDVNGLHELNNAKGHKAGDDMLCYIADAVKKQFGCNNSYRIGGDEYVAFAVDTSYEEIEKRLKDMDMDITAQGYHCAVGYEYSEKERSDINELITAAETKMYKNKSEYYKSHDRRSRK